MTVYFIGAGPGDPELLTLKAARLIAAAPVIIHAGSLVPRAVWQGARADARIFDSAHMTLDAIIEQMAVAHGQGCDVARLHTGDSAIFGATAEQISRLDALGIPWQIVPGVSSFSAAAAALGTELTMPEVSQTIILTRAPGRTPMPAGEQLGMLASHRSSMVIFLSIHLIDEVVAELQPHFGPTALVKVVWRASWPTQKIVIGTLATIAAQVREAGIDQTALIFVGGAISHEGALQAHSKLYDAHFSHGYRTALDDQSRREGEP